MQFATAKIEIVRLKVFGEAKLIAKVWLVETLQRHPSRWTMLIVLYLEAGMVY